MVPLSPGNAIPSRPPTFGATKRLDEMIHGATAPIDPSHLPPAFHASGSRSGRPAAPYVSAPSAPSAPVPAPARPTPAALIVVVIVLAVLALFALGAGAVFFFLR